MFEPDDSDPIDEVVSMGKCMGLEAECEDVRELLKTRKLN